MLEPPPPIGGVDGCWSFRGIGCSLLVVMFKETTRKKLDSGISIFLSLYIYPSLSYLTMGVETKGVGIKGGKKKN